MTPFRFASRQTMALSAGLLLAGAALGAASQGWAQTPAPRAPAPAAAASASTTYDLKGFRSAYFGYTAPQVRQAIGADFGAAARITETSNPAEGTQVLQVTVPAMEPGPGQATLTYIFGASSKTLQNVNVVWVLDGEPTADQRQAVYAAGFQLANYFQTLPAPPKIAPGPVPLSPNELLMLSATDRKGASVQIVCDGITYSGTQENKPFTSPTPKGPATLRVSYILNPANPDIAKIRPGSF